MDVLLIEHEGKSKDDKSHAVYINAFNRFIIVKQGIKTKQKFSMKCLDCFSSEQILTNHCKVCLKLNDKQRVNMPEKGSNVQFINYHKKLQTRFIIYAEFKPNLKEVQKPNKYNSDVSYTDKYQTYIACSYGYKVVCANDRFSKTAIILRQKCILKFN